MFQGFVRLQTMTEVHPLFEIIFYRVQNKRIEHLNKFLTEKKNF